MILARPSLTGMPPETLNKIFDFKTLDYKEILHLRPVCRYLKNHVDNHQPDFHHKYIIVNVITNGFFVCFGNNLNEIENKNYMKKVMTVAGDEDMWRTLETVIAHQKSPLEVFQLNCEWEENEKVFVKVLDKIRTILTARNRQLQVNRFQMHALHEDHLMRALTVLNPGTLESICLDDMLPLSLRREEKKVIDVLKVKETEQWKRANEFSAVNFLINDFFDKIQDFEHFKTVSITMDTLKMSDVVKLKEKLYVSPVKKFVTIKYRNLDRDADIPEGHLPMTAPNVYEFPIPDQNKHVLLELKEKCVEIGIYDTVHVDGEDVLLEERDFEFDDQW